MPKFSFLLFLFAPLLGQEVFLEPVKPNIHIQELLYEPYYDYSLLETKEASRFSSDFTITKESLKKWDRLVKTYFHERPHNPGAVTRVFTYLYTAQADFAFVAQEIHGELKGSLDPISLGIIRLFYPLFPSPKNMQIDTFSLILADIVLQKFRKRANEENQSTGGLEQYFAGQQASNYQPEFGKNILKWKTWVLQPYVTKLVPPPPPIYDQVIWQAQIEGVINSMQSATQEEIAFAKKWGNFFTEGWLEIANHFFFSQTEDLDKIFFVRYTNAIGLYDSLINCLEAKYTYLIPPPHVLDPKIKPFVPVFDYPSYPSVHTVVSVTSATILGHFFPDHAQKWLDLAARIGESRVYSGANYQIDVTSGKEAGRRIAERVLLEW